MATWYGQTPGDVIVGDTNADTVPDVIASGSTLEIWSLDRSAQIVDLLDANGNPVTTVTADAKGRAIFAQPADGAGSVWGKDSGGNFWLFVPNDLAERITSGGTVAPTWAEVTDKPSTFPPTAHGHAWADITGTPATYPPSTHTHDDRYYTEAEINDKLANVGFSGTYRPAIRVYETAGAIPARTDVTDDPEQPVEVILTLGSAINPYSSTLGYVAGFDTVGKTIAGTV